MRTLAISALALPLLAGCNPAAHTPTRSTTPLKSTQISSAPSRYERLAQRLDASIPQVLEEARASSISIAVVDGQDVVYRRSFGVARRTGEVTATTNTRYEIGSISKPFVGIAVMQQVDAGALDLDAPITTYIPEFEVQSRFGTDAVPTLRTLLSHRAGLPSDLTAVLDAPDYEIAQLPEVLRQQWLTHAPGRATIYSSVGIDLAALVVQRITGQEYSAYLEESVLRPLGMNTATARGTSEDDATGHDFRGNPVAPITYKPCASIRASVTEMAQLIKWVNGHGRVGDTQVLSPEGADEMMRAQNTEVPLDLGATVGLSWFIKKGSEATGDILEHKGATMGFISAVSVARKHSVGVVVLANDRNPVVGTVAGDALSLALQIKAGLDLTAELRAINPAPPPPAVALTPETLGDLAAVAYSDGAQVFHFEHHRGALQAQLRDTERLKLTPREDGTFDMQRYRFGLPIGEFIPDHRATFETLDGHQVLVARSTRGAFIIAKHFEPGEISDAWKRRAGVYRPADPDKTAINRVRLFVEDGALTSEVHLDGQDEPIYIVLEVHSDALASVAGHGRQSGGAVVAARRDGRTILRSESLEFIKID